MIWDALYKLILFVFSAVWLLNNLPNEHLTNIFYFLIKIKLIFRSRNTSRQYRLWINVHERLRNWKCNLCMNLACLILLQLTWLQGRLQAGQNQKVPSRKYSAKFWILPSRKNCGSHEITIMNLKTC